MSTPAPPASFLHRLSGAVLYLFSGLVVLILIGAALLSLFSAIDWQALSGPVLMLVLMLGVLYWTTTLLPGPVKKLGKMAGRQVMKSMRRKGRDGH